MAADRKKKTVDSLIKRFGEAKYNQVPEILLEGRDLLTDQSNIQETKDLLWGSGFMTLLSNALERDYLKVKNDWLTASKISDFLTECCQSNNLASKSNEFNTSFLPDTCKHLWTLLCNIHQIYLQNKGLKRLEVSYRNVSVNIYILCKSNPALGKIGFESPNIIKMLESEFTVLDLTLLELCGRLSKTDKIVVKNLPSDRRTKIFSALLAKFLAARESKLASLSLNCLVTWLETWPELINIINDNLQNVNEGIDRWKGQNFDSDLSKLRKIIGKTTSQRTEQEEIENAATTIQSAWKSYATRRQLAKIKSGFATLQELFKKKKTEKLDTEKLKQLESEKLFEVKLKNLKGDVKFLEKQYSAISGIHSSLVDRFLEERADRAAKTIQSAWKGYKIRKEMNAFRQEAMINQAAKTIQKAMKHYTNRRKRIKYRLREWPDLTETRREELQRKIDFWNDERKGRSYPDRKSLEELHNQVQEKLVDHYANRFHELNVYQRREALLARLQLDSELLENAPKLNEVTEKDSIMFASRNGAVSLTAIYAHRHAIQLETMPKWKRTLLELETDE